MDTFRCSGKPQDWLIRNYCWHVTNTVLLALDLSKWRNRVLNSLSLTFVGLLSSKHCRYVSTKVTICPLQEMRKSLSIFQFPRQYPLNRSPFLSQTPTQRHHGVYFLFSRFCCGVRIYGIDRSANRSSLQITRVSLPWLLQGGSWLVCPFRAVSDNYCLCEG